MRPANWLEGLVVNNEIKYWYQNNRLHREDGPAVIYPNGVSEWYSKGKLHRLDGPAIEYPDGTGFWMQYNKLHREDGPAVERPDQCKTYYLEGVFVPVSSPEEFDEYMKFRKVRSVLES